MAAMLLPVLISGQGGAPPPPEPGPAERVRATPAPESVRESSGLPADAAPPARGVAERALETMSAAADALRDYTMVLVRQERHGAGLEPERVYQLKWARPHSVYLRKLNPPQLGQEALYVEGRNRNRVRVHKGSFPDITVNLDPRGALAMSGNHHPISEVGMVHIVRLISDNVLRARRRGEGTIVAMGSEVVAGRPSVRVRLESPSKSRTVVLGQGETLWELARRTGQNMSVILNANRDRGWRSADDPRPRDRVIVPEYYASRMDLWLDAENGLPVRIMLYDGSGQLYERYEHREVEVNVGLTDRDFDPANPDYDF